MTDSTRREFLQTTAVAAGAAVLASGVHAGGSDVIRIGLIGCGGRGTGAATEALKADSSANSKLVAMGDVFADQIDSHLGHLQRDAELAKRVDVPKERRFVGFDAYKQ